MNGPQTGCPPPLAPAADYGLCHVVGPILTITSVSAARAAGGQDGYYVYLRVPASQQAAVAAFMQRAVNHEITIIVGETPWSSELVGGTQSGSTVVLPARNRARAERLFRRLTGGA